MDSIKEKVKELRKKRGWSQEDLAQDIDVSLSTVQCWEKQGGSQPDLPAVSYREFSGKQILATIEI